MSAVYHSGELAVQSRAGVSESAARAGRMIKATIPQVAAEFMEQQRFAVLGALDARGRVWASLLTGDRPFIRTLDARTVRLLPELNDYDPLTETLKEGCEAGVVVIDFSTRRRMRINGRAKMFGKALFFQTSQVYSNCPQFIKVRLLQPDDEQPEENFISRNSILSGAQQDWIRRAETFFIASYHPRGGGDASHRGGPPGFVEVINDISIKWPDYSGNAMMNTLGNLYSHPATGLLFINFEHGRTLQLTGKAQINWPDSRAQRAVTFDIHEVIEIRGACRLRWSDDSTQ